MCSATPTMLVQADAACITRSVPFIETDSIELWLHQNNLEKQNKTQNWPVSLLEDLETVDPTSGISLWLNRGLLNSSMLLKLKFGIVTFSAIV